MKMMMYDNRYSVDTIYFFILFIKTVATMNSYRFERQIGSTITFQPCIATVSSSIDDTAVNSFQILMFFYLIFFIVSS